MRWIALFLIFATSVVGQTMLPRVDSEEAAKHFLKGAPPIYPPSAEATRISGVVLLEISIEPSGKTRFRRVISGHPMLVDAAVMAVKGWQFRPFVIDGQPATIVTAVMVGFGKNEVPKNIAPTELSFQYNFWTAENLARAALAKGDLVGAEEQLKKAQDFLRSVGDGLTHVTESRQLTVDEGDLRKAQQK